MRSSQWLVALLAVGIFFLVSLQEQYLGASTFREAPMIANDPSADKEGLQQEMRSVSKNKITAL